MLIRNLKQSKLEPVQMDGVDGTRMAVMVGKDDGAPHFAMRHVEIRPGGHSPLHSHDYEHEVYVVSGTGTVLLEGQDQPIKTGDAILVPAGETHQFKGTGEEPLCFLCMVPVEQNCGGSVPCS